MNSPARIPFRRGARAAASLLLAGALGAVSTVSAAADPADPTDPSAPAALPDLPAPVGDLAAQVTGSSVLPRTGGVPADAPAVPSGVAVDHVEWVTDHRVNLYVTSAAMPGAPVEVQMLLPEDWYTDPTASFPTVWQLGALFGSEEENTWLSLADSEQWYADKNVTVVMPVGGGGSFYTDWEQPDAGETLKWETFLTAELPGILARDWRANDRRAVLGASMGASSAVILAARNPGLFQWVGSFSGYLDMSSPGMPEAVDTMVKLVGRESATHMWGPFFSQQWLEHDPKLLVGNLRHSTVWAYAGTGLPAGYDGAAAETDATTRAAAAAGTLFSALEAVSRLSTQTFAAEAAAAGVSVDLHLAAQGTHSYEWWTPALHAAWPSIAATLGVAV